MRHASAAWRTWLPATGSALVILAWAILLARQTQNYNYGDSFAPTLVSLGELQLVPDSAPQWFYGSARTVLPDLFALVCRTTGMTPETLHHTVTIVTLVAALASIGRAAAAISGSAWAGLAAIVAVPFSWMFALAVGYFAPFWSGFALAGYWGCGWACALWGVWLTTPSSGWRSAVPYALAGAAFLGHPVWASALLLIMVSDECLGLVAGPSRPKQLQRALVKGMVFLIIASPQLYLLVSNVATPVGGDVMASWWSLMQFRKSFHVFIWETGVPYAHLAKLTILSAVSTVIAWPFLDGELRRRVGATFAGVALLTAISFSAIQLVPTPTIAALVVSRGMALASVGVIVLVAAAMVRTSGVRAAMLIAAWIAIAVPAELPWLQQASNTFMSHTPALFQPATDFGLSFAIAAGALIAAAAWPSRLLAVAPRLRLGMLAGMSAALLAIKVPLVPRSLGAVPPESWASLTQCIRDRTAPDDLLVMPPYPYAIASTRRSSILDYTLIGASIYNPAMTPFELKALLAIYDVDLRGIPRNKVSSYVAAHDGNLCMLERGYLDLIGDERRVLALKAAFPSAAYLVGMRPGVRPHEWVCGVAERPLLPLPTTCDTGDYVLYDIRSVPADRKGDR